MPIPRNRRPAREATAAKASADAPPKIHGASTLISQAILLNAAGLTLTLYFLSQNKIQNESRDENRSLGLSDLPSHLYQAGKIVLPLILAEKLASPFKKHLTKLSYASFSGVIMTSLFMFAKGIFLLSNNYNKNTLDFIQEKHVFPNCLMLIVYINGLCNALFYQIKRKELETLLYQGITTDELAKQYSKITALLTVGDAYLHNAFEVSLMSNKAYTLLFCYNSVFALYCQSQSALTICLLSLIPAIIAKPNKEKTGKINSKAALENFTNIFNAHINHRWFAFSLQKPIDTLSLSKGLDSELAYNINLIFNSASREGWLKLAQERKEEITPEIGNFINENFPTTILIISIEGLYFNIFGQRIPCSEVIEAVYYAAEKHGFLYYYTKPLTETEMENISIAIDIRSVANFNEHIAKSFAEQINAHLNRAYKIAAQTKRITDLFSVDEKSTFPICHEWENDKLISSFTLNQENRSLETDLKDYFTDVEITRLENELRMSVANPTEKLIHKTYRAQTIETKPQFSNPREGLTYCTKTAKRKMKTREAASILPVARQLQHTSGYYVQWRNLFDGEQLHTDHLPEFVVKIDGGIIGSGKTDWFMCLDTDHVDLEDETLKKLFDHFKHPTKNSIKLLAYKITVGSTIYQLAEIRDATIDARILGVLVNNPGEKPFIFFNYVASKHVDVTKSSTLKTVIERARNASIFTAGLIDSGNSPVESPVPAP